MPSRYCRVGHHDMVANSPLRAFHATYVGYTGPQKIDWFTRVPALIVKRGKKRIMASTLNHDKADNEADNQGTGSNSGPH